MNQRLRAIFLLLAPGCNYAKDCQNDQLGRTQSQSFQPLSKKRLQFPLSPESRKYLWNYI